MWARCVLWTLILCVCVSLFSCLFIWFLYFRCVVAAFNICPVNRARLSITLYDCVCVCWLMCFYTYFCSVWIVLRKGWLCDVVVSYPFLLQCKKPYFQPVSFHFGFYVFYNLSFCIYKYIYTECVSVTRLLLAFGAASVCLFANAGYICSYCMPVCAAYVHAFCVCVCVWMLSEWMNVFASEWASLFAIFVDSFPCRRISCSFNKSHPDR